MAPAGITNAMWSLTLLAGSVGLGFVGRQAMQPMPSLDPSLLASVDALARETLARNMEKMEAELQLLQRKVDASQDIDRELNLRVNDLLNNAGTHTASAELARVRALAQQLLGGQAATASVDELSLASQSADRLLQDVADTRTALERSNHEHIEKYRELRLLVNGQSDEHSDSVAAMVRRQVETLQQGIQGNQAELAKLASTMGNSKSLLDRASELATTKDVKSASWDVPDDALVDAITQQEKQVKKWMQDVLAQEAACVSAHDVQDMIQNRLRLKTADDVGLRDFALDQNNGVVVHALTAPAYNPSGGGFVNYLSSALGKVINDNSSFPELAISQSVVKGDCFAFEGGTGNLTVQLGQPIMPGAITLEHLNRLYGTTGGSSAPREFTVWGFTDAASLKAGQGFKVVEAEYRLGDPDTVQTFRNVDHGARGQKMAFTTLEVKSNWGSEYTCLYRFRVHSDEPST